MPLSSAVPGSSRPGSPTRVDLPGLAEVPLDEQSFAVLVSELEPSAWARLEAACERATQLFAGRTIWFVSSTARGGGVAEMNRTTLPYWRGIGIDARWLVIRSGPAFFRLTKRLHNMLHGLPSRPLGTRDRSFYERVSDALAREVASVVRPGDVVILHDPQTAGLAPLLAGTGAALVWRCHVGADTPTGPVRQAWRFLLPSILRSHVQVFTRRVFVPPELDDDRALVFPPAIDPCSTKNQPMTTETAAAILRHCGLVQGGRRSPAARRTIERLHGGSVLVDRRVRVARAGAAPHLGDDRLVVALSRWDRLKDPAGIVRAFAEHVSDPRARLIVAGPAGVSVADDPEGTTVHREVRAAWAALPPEQRRRIDLAVFPMVDFDENALIVNALQRHAAVVVKKSIQEGFGFGVTEALWKARPVVATRVGGHQDQIEHRRSGLLVDDAQDLAGFGAAVEELLDHPDLGAELGRAGRGDVRSRYLVDRHFGHWVSVGRAALVAAQAERPRGVRRNADGTPGHAA